MSLQELDDYLDIENLDILNKLNDAIDSMERGNLIPHEKAMEMIWEEVFGKNV